MGRTVTASPGDPRSRVRSDESGRWAVHEPSAWKKERK
ncbi:HVA1 family protein [Kitasatospora sp. NPDC093679]